MRIFSTPKSIVFVLCALMLGARLSAWRDPVTQIRFNPAKDGNCGWVYFGFANDWEAATYRIADLFESKQRPSGIAQKITLNSPLFETADPTDVLLKEFAISIDASQTDKFSFMKNRLDDVRIVGFGEDTHGTAEFNELAVELMIYLAEDHGYRTFIIENGFGETTYLNDFINGRTNEAEVVLKTKISTWRYQTTQFVGLLNRLRQYNQTLPEKSIQLFGMEMHYPHEEAKLLNQYLSKCGHSRFNSVGTVSDDVGCDHSEHDTDP